MTLPTEFLVHFADLLDRLGIPYHVGGSVASSAHGMYLASADIDFVIDPTPDQLNALAAEIDSEFYVSRTAMAEALASRGTFNAIHEATSFKIDWFRRGGEVSDRQWQDVLSILMASRRQLDETHLDRGSRELGIADLLERARRAVADV